MIIVVVSDPSFAHGMEEPLIFISGWGGGMKGLDRRGKVEKQKRVLNIKIYCCGVFHGLVHRLSSARIGVVCP